MLKVLVLLVISLSTFAAPRATYPPGGFQDNFWRQVQIQHLLTQQQLQAQDQYRRQLLSQDQQRQIQLLQDNQNQLEYMQHNSTMHGYSDRLKMYSQPLKSRPDVVKKKHK